MYPNSPKHNICLYKEKLTSPNPALLSPLLDLNKVMSRQLSLGIRIFNDGGRGIQRLISLLSRDRCYKVFLISM